MIAKADKVLNQEEYGLTHKQWLFALGMYTPGSESEGNGTESARQAGYKGSDYTLGRAAHDNTRNHKVMEAKKLIQGEVYVLTAEKVLNRLMLLSGLEEAVAGDVAKPSTTDAGQIRSLDLLGKHLKLWDRAGEQDHTDQPDDLTTDERKQLLELSKRLSSIKLTTPSSGPDSPVESRTA